MKGGGCHVFTIRPFVNNTLNGHCKLHAVCSGSSDFGARTAYLHMYSISIFLNTTPTYDVM